jgi:hypothetical protein
MFTRILKTKKVLLFSWLSFFRAIPGNKLLAKKGLSRNAGFLKVSSKKGWHGRGYTKPWIFSRRKAFVLGGKCNYTTDERGSKSLNHIQKG